MIVLVCAFAFLIFAFYRLFRRRDSSKQSDQTNPSSSNSSVIQKLVSEAFEYSTFSTDQNSVIYPILILYATEYGFARQVAITVAQHFKSLNDCLDQQNQHVIFSPRIINVLHYSLIDFTREPIIVFICSTTGDGVPPNEAATFRDALVSKDLQLPIQSKLAILALGDRAYPHFCRAGAIFEQLFGKHSQFVPRVNVDQENWDVIHQWIQQFQSQLYHTINQSKLQQQHDYLPNAIEKYSKSFNTNQTAQYTLNNPYQAQVISKTILTKSNPSISNPKQVIRIELDISDSSLDYNVGDAVAILPENNPDHVLRLLLATATNGDEMVKLSEKGELVSFDQALTKHFDLKTIKPELVLYLAKQSIQSFELEQALKIFGFDVNDTNIETKHVISLTEYGKQYMKQREICDVLADFSSASITPSKLVSFLRPLHARYYSISSTSQTCPDKIAITVDVLRYFSLNIEREGVASTFLNDRCNVNNCNVGIFLSRNPNFRLPTDLTRPILMIGPGTGIAPFIGFIEERIYSNAIGENWLFFGCRHEKQDFLYEDRLKQWERDGHVRLDTAFSRDGHEKVYVQHRMQTHQKSIWKLMEKENAHIYVCGDGGHMAKDVDLALKNIIMEVGQKAEQEAIIYLEKLAEAKRYQRDVWVS